MAQLLPLFDLHVHSTRSDGLRSPMELVQMAERSGLAGIAITDHDILPDETLLGHLRSQSGLHLLSGVELSTQFSGRPLHLLGYGFDGSRGDLGELCRSLVQARRARMDGMVSRIRSLVPSFQAGMLDGPGGPASLGRKHLARELIRQRFASSSRVAFEKYLTPIASEIPLANVAIEEAIDAIHSSGGVAVLAHPPTGMSIGDWRRLGGLSLDGIETRFGRVAASHRRFLEARSMEYDWIGTAGSDYHGDGGRNQLGLHTVTREVMDSLLDRRPVG
jgi:predicted metal-dependent phosphoesterase TrpH